MNVIKIRFFFQILIFSSSLAFVVFHIGKTIILKGSTFDFQQARTNLFQEIKINDSVFFFDEVFYGTFIELFENDNKFNVRAKMLFPFSEQGPSYIQRKEAKNYLINTFPKKLTNGGIVGLNKKKQKSRLNGKELHLYHSLGELLIFNIEKVIYEDKKYLIFRTDSPPDIFPVN